MLFRSVDKFNGVIYEGGVILGPYLSYEHTRHLVQGVLENKELSVEQREKLQTFFSILPIVDFNKEEAFAHILKSLMYSTVTVNEAFVLEEQESEDEIDLHYLVEDIALKEDAIRSAYEQEEQIIHYMSTGNMRAIAEMIKGDDVKLLNR